MSSARRPSLPVLTSLRFFAAVEVVAFHIIDSNEGRNLLPDGFLKGVLSGGPAAVTFFFILSGFILTYVHAGKREEDCEVEPMTFWRLRIARIVPAYFFSLLLALPALSAFLNETTRPMWEKIVAPILVVSFLQSWWPTFAIWNGPAWSLSVECFFYALFPCMARALSRLGRPSLFSAAYALIIASASIRPDLLPPRFQNFFPLFHLPYFVFGMALGRQHLFGRSLPVGWHAAMFYLGVTTLTILFGLSWLLPSWMKSGPVLVPSFALVILGGARPSRAMTLLNFPILVLLGEASYSTYILHEPLRIWLMMLGLNISLWFYLPTYAAVVVAISLISFKYVETPLRERIAFQRDYTRRKFGFNFGEK